MKTQDLNKTSAREIILTTIMQDGKISVSDNRLDNQDLVNDLVAMISDLLPKLKTAPINDSIPSPATLGQPGAKDAPEGQSPCANEGLGHTPLPWSIDDRWPFKDDQGRSFPGIFKRTDNGDLLIASFEHAAVREQVQANADFIVRAVNAHDELVAACQEAYASMVWEQELQDGRAESVHAAIGTAKIKLYKAIAKATKGQP